MTVTQVQIADAVARMLRAEVANPQAEFAYIPKLERPEVEEVRLFCVPGDVSSTLLTRRGDRSFVRDVSIAIVRSCQPTDSARITELLGFCTAVAEALAVHSPLDESDEPLGLRCQEIIHEPLYSVDQLRAGVFLGVITARYTP